MGVKLCSHQSQQVLLSAELHKLSLAMSSSCSANLTVQQVLVQASSRSSVAAPTSATSSSSSQMVPILQVPMSDLQAFNIQSYSRFSAAEQQQQQQQQQSSRSGQQQQQYAGDGGEDTEAASPKPSSLGRIYHESPLSTYISHIQVCVSA